MLTFNVLFFQLVGRHRRDRLSLGFHLVGSGRSVGTCRLFLFGRFSLGRGFAGSFRGLLRRLLCSWLLNFRSARGRIRRRRFPPSRCAVRLERHEASRRRGLRASTHGGYVACENGRSKAVKGTEVVKVRARFLTGSHQTHVLNSDRAVMKDRDGRSRLETRKQGSLKSREMEMGRGRRMEK